MASSAPRSFRLIVLNPGGRDPEQFFPEGAGEPSREHAPVNFHAFAACTGGSFRRETRGALAERGPVLLLLRRDFRAAERALRDLKKSGRVVAVSLKETGLHQIAQQLRDTSKLTRFTKIVTAADLCLGTTPEAAAFYRSILPASRSDRAVFIPTPYPVDDERWNFSRLAVERSGILVGTREWNVPSRNHLAALLLARRLCEITGEPVSVHNGDARGGLRLLGALDFPARKLRVFERRLAYQDYLREVSQHKIVLQLDSSFVPGQVAGDALLCRMLCLGGNGAIDRIAFADTCGFGRTIAEVAAVAESVLRDSVFHEQMLAASQQRARKELSFKAIARKLEELFLEMAARA
jgi:hypothetical protein